MRGIAGTLLCLLLLNGAVTVRAATRTAASCNVNDVQAAINQAAAGDTVVIPAGTCRWTTSVSWNAPANVTLQGAGSETVLGGGDATVIIDDYSSNSPLLRLYPNASGTFRMYGITFRGGSGGLKDGGLISVSGSSRQIRIDHIHIDMQAYNVLHTGKPMYIAGPLNGVIDHIIIDLAKQGFIEFDGDNAGPGDVRFNEATGYGGSDFIFLEDNRFRATRDSASGLYLGTTTDCRVGGKFILRYNTVSGAGFAQTHPTGGAGRGRGCRAHEVYGNTASPAAGYDPTTQQPNFAFAWISSGTALFWGNTSNSASSHFIFADSMRKSNATYAQSPTPNGWGYCGTSFNGVGSNWDGNTDANGYPCLDQPGRGRSDLLSGQFPNAVNMRTGTISWPNQELEPVREWLNTFVAVPGWGNASSNRFSVASGVANRLAENRDFYRYTPSFDGTTGVGVGTRASRPTACTTGVAYWSTDQGGNWNAVNGTSNDGTLDVCTATNSWTNGWYTPYPYPHPLTQGQGQTSGPSGPAPPSGLRIVSGT
jgi:hypothetical protein